MEIKNTLKKYFSTAKALYKCYKMLYKIVKVEMKNTGKIQLGWLKDIKLFKFSICLAVAENIDLEIKIYAIAEIVEVVRI